MIKVLINTISAKKRGGGVFQISCNYLLKTLEHPDIEWYYLTSKDVDEVIGLHFSHIRNSKYFVYPTQIEIKSYFYVRKEINRIENEICPDIIYSIAAPSYFHFRSLEVMRCTNPWVSHPNKYSWKVLTIRQQLQYRLKALLTKALMRKVHYFVTQTETCKRGIIQITGENSSHIKVVSNVLPYVFKNMDTTPICDDKYFNIACIGGAIPHKNIDILPAVTKELRSLGIMNFRFHTTIAQNSELAVQIKDSFIKNGLQNHWVNHGRISQQELGEVYRRCQFCFFPTLLEVFSASTLEAMFFGLPSVATNFDFNIEVFGDSCLYYEPMNAKDAAKQLYKVITNNDLQNDLKLRMRKRLGKYGDYDRHFNDIKDFLIQVSRKEHM